MNLRKKVTAAFFGTLLGVSVLSSSVYADTTGSAAKTQTESTKKERPERKDFLKELVESGKLSETTYENIQKYRKENRPEKKEKTETASDSAGGTTARKKPAKKRDTDGTDAVSGTTAAGESGTTAAGGKKAGGRRGHGGMMREETLQKLLEAGIISQSEYDVIKENMPERPAKPEKSSGATTEA